jgi:hypothetical protein
VPHPLCSAYTHTTTHAYASALSPLLSLYAACYPLQLGIVLTLEINCRRSLTKHVKTSPYLCFDQHRVDLLLEPVRIYAPVSVALEEHKTCGIYSRRFLDKTVKTSRFIFAVTTWRASTRQPSVPVSQYIDAIADRIELPEILVLLECLPST